MNAFKDERLSVFEFDHVPFFALACFEVVSRKLNFFAADKFFDIACKLFQVQGFDGFKIVVAVFIQRRIVTVYEIIIQLQWEG